MFDDDQKWQSQISGKGGMLSSLNQRLFMIRRLKNSLNYEGLRKVSESLFISKVRYGLQLMGEVRWKNEDPESVAFSRIQKSQNKLLRFLNKTSIKDKISTKSMLEKHKMLSINQINAQIKLTEIWKAMKDEDHPFKVKTSPINPEERTSRGQAAGYIKTKARSNVTKKTFINDSIKAWNKAPNELKNTVNINGAKAAIKNFVKTIPI